MKKTIYLFLINLISNLIILIHRLNILFFLKYDLLSRLSDKIDDHKYCYKIINNKKINFYIPTEITHSRVQSIFAKEPETINWINNFKDKKIFWDIGANVGIYSIYAAAKYNRLKIIAFEPSTSNTRTLSRNISINKFENNIKIFPIALCDKPNIISKFNENKFYEGWSGSTFDNNFDADGNKLLKKNIKNNYQIFGTSIHEILSKNILEVPNYMKIDVDGIEHLILKGAKNFLKHKNLEEILVEMNPSFKSQFNLIEGILKKHGFTKTISTNRRILKDPNNISNYDTLNTIYKKNKI